MRAHHTKNKGDLGVLHAQLDLARRGYTVLLPLTEHAAFDVVAYKDHRFLRVQVKYRAAPGGLISLPLSTCWADRNGTHTVPMDRTSIDLLCIFCPDTQRCYYVDPATRSKCIQLRISAPRNDQKKGIRWAKDFEEIPSTVLGVSAGYSRPLEARAYMRQSAPRWGLRSLRAHSSAG